METSFFPKCFYGHVECSFHQPAENFVLNVAAVKKSFFRKKYFVLKMFLGNLEISFDHQAGEVVILDVRK